jgi:hypothetical protein
VFSPILAAQQERAATMNLPLVERELALPSGSPPGAGLASSFERRRLRFYLVQIVLDIAALAAAFLLTSPILGRRSVFP